ncbi:multidrug DMT transporter permease [Roseomonas rosulenta]|uniref:multidrug DMT transporter permease n=1 Tax=Roseomonas rosulenta TaxID=2748667 RepID=UPI0018DFFA3D|nr:multidrug DMT transporter permease [Roseomonas rosulenta]
MSTYFMATMLLSGGSFIRSRSAAPEMRPASAASDMVWGILARLSLLSWIGLMIFGFVYFHWSQPVAAVMASLAVNALIAARGPRRTWPMLSYLFCTAGLAAGAVVVLR